MTNADRITNALDALDDVFGRARRAAEARDVEPSMLAHFVLGYVEAEIRDAVRDLRALAADGSHDVSP